MAASFPAAPKTFVPINNGDVIVPPMWLDAYEEIAALEQALLSGAAFSLVPDATGSNRHLGSPSAYWGLAYVKALSLAAATEVTVAAGVITVVQGYHAVDTESDAATDDLDTITAGPGLQEGAVLVLRAQDAARVVTAKTGTGNLRLASDMALAGTATLTLLYDGLNWRELARMGGAGASPAPSVSSAGFSVACYHNVAINLSINTDTPLPFNVNEWSHGALHDPTTNNTRFTNTTGGINRFLCAAQIYHRANSGGFRSLWLRKGGLTPVSGLSAIPGAASGMAVATVLTAMVELAAGEYVEWIARQNVGSTNETGDNTIRQFQNSAQMSVLA